MGVLMFLITDRVGLLIQFLLNLFLFYNIVICRNLIDGYGKVGSNRNFSHLAICVFYSLVLGHYRLSRPLLLVELLRSGRVRL